MSSVMSYLAYALKVSIVYALCASVFSIWWGGLKWSLADQAEDQSCLIMADAYEKEGPQMKEVMALLRQEIAQNPLSCKKPMRIGMEFYEAGKTYFLYGIIDKGQNWCVTRVAKVDFSQDGKTLQERAQDVHQAIKAALEKPDCHMVKVD